MEDPCNKKGPKIPSQVEAFPDQDDGNGYSQITFCPLYFAKPSLVVAIIKGLSSGDHEVRFNLETYENRGMLCDPLFIIQSIVTVFPPYQRLVCCSEEIHSDKKIG